MKGELTRELKTRMKREAWLKAKKDGIVPIYIDKNIFKSRVAPNRKAGESGLTTSPHEAEGTEIQGPVNTQKRKKTKRRTKA